MKTLTWPAGVLKPRLRCPHCRERIPLEARVAPHLASLLDHLERGDPTSLRRERLARGAAVLARLIRVEPRRPD